MGIKQELGAKIKRTRKKCGFTQEQLAEMVDISLRTMSGIESGENFISAETLDKILVALNTSSEELFASEHIKSSDALASELIEHINMLREDKEKLETVYKVVKALLRQ